MIINTTYIKSRIGLLAYGNIFKSVKSIEYVLVNNRQKKLTSKWNSRKVKFYVANILLIKYNLSHKLYNQLIHRITIYQVVKIL